MTQDAVLDYVFVFFYQNLVLQLPLPVLVWETLQRLHLDKQENQCCDTMGRLC